MSKTIIINSGRVGGSLLVKALNSHSQLKFTGEILNLFTPSIPTEAREILEKVCGPLPTLRDKKSNHHIPTEYIEQLLEINDGFKMLYYELNQDIITYLLDRKDVNIIHLKRWNVMEQCVSKLSASKTRVYHVGIGHRNHVPKLHINPRDMEKYFRRYINEQKRYDKMFQGSMIVFYEDLIGEWDQSTKKIQEHIGVEPEKPPITQGKVIKNPMQEVVENYRELYYHFEKTKYREYFKAPILYL